MDSLDVIVAYVEKYVPLTADEKDFFISRLKVTNIKRKQFISQPEFVPRYRNYVIKGAVRAYLRNNEGEEFTIALAIEDWWITDYYSYINQVPGILFVEALEDTIVIQIDYNSEQLLLEKIPKFERFFRIITQRSFAFLQHRMLSNLSKTAEERYDEFAGKYPAIVARIPQYVLASYLGFSTEFLSRIRNRRTKKLN